MAIHPPPRLGGQSLLNLASEVELRMTGQSLHPALVPGLSEAIPAAATYVVVLIDGLGTHQLGHPAAPDLAAALAGSIDAPFPTTTTVSLATLATARPPAEHGLIGYLQWDPTVGTILNTIHMTSAWGEPVSVDVDRYLPEPNLWERLTDGGREPVVVQPLNFSGSALTRVLYRGARFEGYANPDEAVAVTRDVALHEGRLIVLYLPFVDVAAHVSGQASEAYTRAMSLVDGVWRSLVRDLPDHVTLLGTADHGHVDIADHDKVRLTSDARIFGDGRALYVTGDVGEVAETTGGDVLTTAELEAYLGGPVAPPFRDRLPDGVVMMPDGRAAFPPHMNDRLVGHHGGLSAEERTIPLLVRR